MTFVIFHGAFGGPEENWFPQLKESLEGLGQQVITPQFPIDNWDEVTGNGLKVPPKNQTLDNWMKVFSNILPEIKDEGKLVFIGHSLGPVFILHIVEKYNIKLDCAIFVIPFMSPLKRPDLWQFDLVNASFYKENFDFEKLRKLIPLSYVLYSDNDPYVDKKYSLKFAEKMGSSKIIVQRAGHMNMEVNLNEFPLVLELCKSRLDLNLYQKYTAHRRELFALDYTKGKSEEVIYIKPEEIFDEGLFHFRNLKKEGFCTFFTGLKFWNTQNPYYNEARKAARRIKNFTRVFILNNLSDLKNPRLMEQIKLDFESGIKIYFCMFDQIKNLIKDPDFGIWDQEYLCVVPFGHNMNVTDVRLSSRKEDIDKACLWRNQIMKYSVSIIDLEKDIKSFVEKTGEQ